MQRQREGRGHLRTEAVSVPGADNHRTTQGGPGDQRGGSGAGSVRRAGTSQWKGQGLAYPIASTGKTEVEKGPRWFLSRTAADAARRP